MPHWERAPLEIGKAFEFGLATPKEVIEYNKNISGTNNEAYTFSSGGVEWLTYDFEISGRNFSYASTVIGGECYLWAACSMLPMRRRLSPYTIRLLRPCAAWENELRRIRRLHAYRTLEYSKA